MPLSFVAWRRSQATHHSLLWRHPCWLKQVSFIQVCQLGRWRKHDILVHCLYVADTLFEYTAGRADTVRCFCCNVGLSRWQAGDEAWEEHARWQPCCNYIIRVKGELYIRHIQQKYATARVCVRNLLTGNLSGCHLAQLGAVLFW